MEDSSAEALNNPDLRARNQQRRHAHHAAAKRPDDADLNTPQWQRESATHVPLAARKMLKAIRAYQHHASRSGPINRLRRMSANLRHRIWSHLCRAHVPLNTSVGGGLLLLHPDGVVIHPDSVIGPNCTILQQVTIGNGADGEGCPTLGAGVDVGAGAKVLGKITVGAGAKIGANAVVVKDVPAGYTAVGIPARNLPPKHLRDAETNEPRPRLTYTTSPAVPAPTDPVTTESN
ncbi:MAG: hypothetical protein AAGD32_08770 [Planctomycetota bacterium]